MPTEKQNQELLDKIAKLRQLAMSSYAAQLVSDPKLAEVLSGAFDDAKTRLIDADDPIVPADPGLAQLIGIGPAAASQLESVRLPVGVTPYDETVTSERINAMAD